MAARTAARFHSAFFKDFKLSKEEWLRGSAWISGGGQELWEAYQGQCRTAWASLDFKDVAWDPLVRQCIDAAIQQAKPESGGFQAFKAWMERAPWSLVHGDFHPANCMLLETDPAASDKDSRFRLLLLDWENVGVGSGPQEIAQFLISHMDPVTRADAERELVREYYSTLIALKPQIAEEMTFDMCWAEYVAGGAGKWAWFLPLLAESCPAKLTQYFHDQLLSFLKTHGVTPDTMPMPRS